MVNMANENQRARFASTLLSGVARTWFTTQQYQLSTLQWYVLKADLMRAFRPADYERTARKALINCK